MNPPKTVELTRDALKNAAKGPDNLSKLRALIEQSVDRKERVSRAETAADIVHGAAPETIVEKEKKAIIQVSSAVLQEAMNSVATELQTTTIPADLERLQKEQEKILAATERVREIEKNLASLNERIAMEGQEIAEEISEGDWKTWLKYGSVAIAGGMITKWVWDHTLGWLWDKTIGNEEKPGWMRKLSGFLATAAGAFAGAIGLKMFLDTEVGKKAKEVVDTGTEIVTKAPEIIVTNASEAGLDSKWGKFLSSEGLKEWIWNGGDLVAVGGVTYLYESGKWLVVEGIYEMALEALEYAQGEDDGWGTAMDIGMLYGLGGAVYFSSFGAIDFVFNIKKGPKHALGAALGKTAMWPFSITGKAKKGASHVFGYMMPTRGGRLKRVQVKTHMNKLADILTVKNGRYAAISTFNSWKLSHMDTLLAEWKAHNKLLATVPIGIEGSDNAKAIIEDRMRVIEERMKKGLEVIHRKTGKMPVFIEDEQLQEQIKHGEVDPGYLQEKLKSMRSGTVATAEVLEEEIEKEHRIENQPTTTEDLSKPEKNAQEEVQQKLDQATERAKTSVADLQQRWADAKKRPEFTADNCTQFENESKALVAHVDGLIAQLDPVKDGKRIAELKMMRAEVEGIETMVAAKKQELLKNEAVNNANVQSSIANEIKPLQKAITDAQTAIQEMNKDTTLDANTRKQKIARISRNLKQELRALSSSVHRNHHTMQKEIAHATALLAKCGHITVGGRETGKPIESHSAKIGDISGTQTELGIDPRTGKIKTDPRSDPNTSLRGKR